MNVDKTLRDIAGRLAGLDSSSVQGFEQAAHHIREDAIRTPLLPHSSGEREIRLKAECLQPRGSFKIRAAASAVARLDSTLQERRIATASAGNFAQGLALAARRRGMMLTAHVPDTAARVKVDAIRALGATVVEHPFAEWCRILRSGATGAADGVFIHPVSGPGVMLGNGTIGLELAEDWPQMDTVVIPFGGGGLASGIALALRALARSVRVVACEIETVTPLASAFAAGSPVHVRHEPSFVDGIGSNGVLEEVWPLLRILVDDVVVVSVEQAKAALRDLISRNHLVAEGAGAVALAAAESPRCGGRNVAAVISGGNIGMDVLGSILMPP